MRASSVPNRLTAEDKLDVLRRLHPNGAWHSLDEKRYCTVCGKVVTGRQIEVVGGARGLGPLRLECPTHGCTSTPAQWIVPAGRAVSREVDFRFGGEGRTPHARLFGPR